jgi:hypothetical protein
VVRGTGTKSQLVASWQRVPLRRLHVVLAAVQCNKLVTLHVLATKSGARIKLVRGVGATRARMAHDLESDTREHVHCLRATRYVGADYCANRRAPPGPGSRPTTPRVPAPLSCHARAHLTALAASLWALPLRPGLRWRGLTGVARRRRHCHRCVTALAQSPASHWPGSPLELPRVCSSA